MGMLTYKSIYVPQIDETDCGAACLAMILKNYHSQVSIAHLRHIAKTNTEGTTALGLVKTAEKFGMDAQAVKANMSLFDMQDIQYPFIDHVIKDGGSHSRNYYNGRGTGRNIRAAGTVANVNWTGVKIISHFLG